MQQILKEGVSNCLPLSIICPNNTTPPLYGLVLSSGMGMGGPSTSGNGEDTCASEKKCSALNCVPAKKIS